MRHRVVPGLILSALVVLAPAFEPAAAAGQFIRFYGRWDLREPDKAITVCSGSHIVAKFEGTAIRAAFNLAANEAPVPTIAWQIDDGEWQEAEIANTVQLGDNLAKGPHTITLMARGLDEHQSRWTPPLVASITFLGFDIKNGQLMESEEEAKPKIEFLGDSITEGVLVHGDREGKTTWPWKTDGRLAYAAQTAMKLKAHWRQVGFGAQGVTHGGSGAVPSALETFNFVYQDCPRDDWQPDVVVVNQGTNDGGAAADVFRPAYKKYLALIREAYPKAKIACLRPFGGAQADNIKAEVKARNDAGDKDVVYIDTTDWLGKDDYTDGVHPNVAGGAKAAERLAKELAPLVK